MLRRALMVMLLFPALLLTGASTVRAPHFAVDPRWPRPLPTKWLFGQVSGVAVDGRDQLYVLHRPETISDDEKVGVECCVAAPPVIVFDQQGRIVRSFGGARRGDHWPHREHSIAVDARDGSLWIGGNGDQDGFVVKYSADGRFLMRIGASGPTRGSNDTTQLGRPAGLAIDAVRRELYIADGYANRRVIVFDADSGAYKRHWGAYGRVPSDAPVAQTMAARRQHLMQPHGIALAADGSVYVGDRPNNRIQVFDRRGTWLRDLIHVPTTGGGTGGATGSVGSVWDLALWPHAGQTHLLVVDGSNNQVRLTDRRTNTVVASFGRAGPYAGQLRGAHAVAVDGNDAVYIAEVATGRRVQRFRPTAEKESRQ